VPAASAAMFRVWNSERERSLGVQSGAADFTVMFAIASGSGWVGSGQRAGVEGGVLVEAARDRTGGLR